MAKANLIPVSVLNQMFNLSIEQIEAVIRSGGGSYKITSVECQGMMAGGTFVYKLTGEKLMKHVSTFKVKIVAGIQFNPDPLRVLDGQFVLCWA